jgi:gliding motility-associated-like protein
VYRGKSLSQADFTAENLCVNNPTYFNSTAKALVTKWQWNFGDEASGAENTSTQQNPSHNYKNAGTYIVQLLATNPCGVTDTVIKPVTIYPDPKINLSQDSVSRCFDQVPVSLEVASFPETTYQWSNGATTAKIQAGITGWYKVVAINPCQSRMDSIYVNIIPQATAYIPDDTIVCDGNFALLNAQNRGATYRWNTGEISSTIQVDKPGTYWVEIQNECSATVDSTNLVFISEEVSAYTTNVFTPNGDGKNDFFINYIINSPNYQMSIVNRWGKTVFESTDPFEYWDGNINGQQAPSGVYYYFIATQDCTGKPMQIKGIVSLLR